MDIELQLRGSGKLTGSLNFNDVLLTNFDDALIDCLSSPLCIVSYRSRIMISHFRSSIAWKQYIEDGDPWTLYWNSFSPAVWCTPLELPYWSRLLQTDRHFIAHNQSTLTQIHSLFAQPRCQTFLIKTRRFASRTLGAKQTSVV